jgi:hypothetical protein
MGKLIHEEETKSRDTVPLTQDNHKKAFFRLLILRLNMTEEILSFLSL